MIIIKILLVILIILAVVNIFLDLFLGDVEGILIAGILCFFIVGMHIMMPITSNTVDKVKDELSTVCEEVASESIEKETAETVVNETPEVTKTAETESTNVETDKAVEELIDSFKGEDSVEGEKSSETSEETEGVSMGTIIIITLIIFSPVLLFIGLNLIEDIINCSSDFVGTCFLKKKKETTTEEFVRETNENSEDNPFIKKIPTPKQKKGNDIDKLAEKDSKIAYIVWAVKFLNDQGKESYTRKLESYYIPEIMQAYEQYQKVKNFHVKEMTAEAKKHYEKIVDLSYKVANVEVKKAAGEIVMDMDCNADVCEDIYKRDGYSSIQEEIVQESHTAEKKKEQALHAKAISKDTYVFWTNEE